MNETMQRHWDRVYRENDWRRVGWYEDTPVMCLKMVEDCGLAGDDPIIEIGAGATTLIDNLVGRGFTNITVTDISGTAVEMLRTRLGPSAASRITWIVDDITAPERLSGDGSFALWHDRAVLHFLLTEEERRGYVTTLHRLVRAGGNVTIAVFSLDGALTCSGLEVERYDEEKLQKLLGGEFELMDAFNHLYHTPAGAPRPYVYTRFKRNR